MTAAVVLLPHDPMKEYYSPGLRGKYQLDAVKKPVPAISETYADIGYVTDKAQWMARTEARLRAGGLEKELPAGWPKVIEGPMVWSADSFKNEDDFVVRLTEEDISEIASALKHFNGDLFPRMNPRPIVVSYVRWY